MNLFFLLRKWLLLSLVATALSLSGCGGGSSSGGDGSDNIADDGGSGSPSDPTTPDDNTGTVGGTAAAGAPLVGFVGARDALGESTTAQIEDDGSFSIDVTTLQPPVLLFASGISGGNAYQLLSVATASDIGNTVNITPFTDLIVGNALGKNPVTAFNESGGDENQRAALFAKLDDETIEQQEDLLTSRLRPLLDALGIDEEFDLRNSSFAADRTGFDAVLDVVEVRVNTTDNSATIRNRLEPDSEISNTFDNTDEETDTIAVDEQALSEGVSTTQTTGSLLSDVATALDAGDRDTLETLLADDFLNNGESSADWLDRLLGTEDAGELADDLRNWSLVSVESGTVSVNVGSPNGPWQAIDDNDDLKLRGNQLQFFAYSEATHIVANGAEPPIVQEIATSLFASNPVDALGTIDTSSVEVSGPPGTPFNASLERSGDLFGTFFVIDENNLDQIQTGDEHTFTWNGASASAQSTYTVRRGEPRLSEGAPEITSSSADLDASEYSFEWTLPPGYESVSVRNNFTGQTLGGEGGGFTGNPLANEARSFTGELPDGFSPQADDEIRLIARDPYGVFVAARLVNPFADQVPPPSDAGALIGSYIQRNTDRTDNAPYIHFTFFESGHYVHLELGDDFRPDPDPNGTTGMEVGTYTWDNETGEFEFTGVLRDQNGEWGPSDIDESEKPLSVQADSDGFTLSFASGGSEFFDRVPANSESGGIAGSWMVQSFSDPTNATVLTLLDDGFYFLGSNQPADDSGQPGLEFGTYTYEEDTTILTATPVYDDNGEYGLSDPRLGFDYVTTIDGFLVVDDGETFQLSEVDGGVTPSDGTLTVDYSSPGAGTDPEPEFGVSGDFHYLRSSSGIEGERSDGPASLYLSSYNYPGTSIEDNGDGTGSISFTDACLSDVLIDAGINQPPTFDTAAFCFGSAGSLTGLTFTERGGTLIIPSQEFTNNSGDEERLGQSEVDLFAADDARSLFLGFGKRTFGYESGPGFTSGLDTGVHVLGEKGSGMVPADLEGDWGMISFQLSDIPDNPDDIEYNANALSINVDAQASATLTSEEVLRVIQGANTNNLFVMPESESRQETLDLGNLTLAGNGELGLFDGEFAGFLSLDQDMLFLSAADPTATGVPSDLGFHEWIAGIRRGATPLQAADLAGKEYARFGQFYWVTEGYFEVDYSQPGSTVTFPIDSSIAEYRRRSDYTYTGFPTGSPTITGESSNPVGYDFEYSVDANGLLTMTSTRSSDAGTDNVVELGWANADASVILIANQYLRTPSDGTDTVGGVGISYLICTNCD